MGAWSSASGATARRSYDAFKCPGCDVLSEERFNQCIVVFPAKTAESLAMFQEDRPIARVPGKIDHFTRVIDQVDQ